MTHGNSFEDVMGGFQFGGFFGILQLALYLFYSYCQYILSKKLNVQYSWMAWIPVLSFFNLVKIAKLSFWWILGIFIPLWNIYVFIKIYHGVSKSTGHGGWWTVGLLLANWLFFPVTAFHYEAGDEVTPRPFMGGKKVILIIAGLILPIIIILGIFAAALFPSMTSYMKRSRDAARMSHLMMLSTNVGAYYADNEKYPEQDPSGCAPNEITTASTKDPVPSRLMQGCDGSNGGTYAYRTGKGAEGQPYFVVGAKMENRSGGNSKLPIDKITSDTPLIRGSGEFYYVVR